MWGGSGRAGTDLLLLLLLVCCHAHPSLQPTPQDATRPHEGVTPTPAHSPGGGRRGRGGGVQYTLDVLPAPASSEEGVVGEGGKLASSVRVEANLLPWLLGGGPNQPACLDPTLASRAAHTALHHNPPPAGVSLTILPPPSDFRCTERHGVEYLLTQMTSPTTQALIGGVEPGLCRVATHLARKYGKLLLPWSCLEVPKPNQEDPASSQEEQEQEEEQEPAPSSGQQQQQDAAGGSHVALVTPTALQVAWAARATLTHLAWRHVSIITLDWSYWRGVAHTVDVELRAAQQLVPTLAVLPPAPSLANITRLYNTRTTQFIKAYLLVVPTWSAVVGQLLQVAEAQGVTKHAAFFILDPQYAPAPAHPRSHAHDARDIKRFRGLKQLSHLSGEAARAVMILAAATRGPPKMAGRGQADSPPGTPHTHTPPGHDGLRAGKDKTSAGEDRRRVLVTPTAVGPAINQSTASESEAVLTRLVYDSVSLLSHLLRANVGTFRLRRRSDATKNHTSEDLKTIAAQNASAKVHRRKRMNNLKLSDQKRANLQANVFEWASFSHLISERDAADEGISSLLIRDMKGDLYLAEDEAERERLYFEMKKLDTEREGREFEKRLESIIGSRRIKENGFVRHKNIEGKLNKSQIIEMKIKRPTFFPALWGDGFVTTWGERRFDFLLLDWRPKTQELAAVLELRDTTLAYSKGGAGAGSSLLTVVTTDEIDWAYDTPIPRDQDCDAASVCGYVVAGVWLAPGYVVMIVLCLLFLLAACCGCAAVLRKRLRQKEMSRGPYKILLTSSDLTLTSRPESAPRKVGDYVCIAGCVLSVLPGSAGTGDRPDLLRGSFSSPHRSIPHEALLSTAAHAVSKDGEEAKAKYNGDFVHVKYFYVQAGNFEVKNRTMTLLKQMRDLRHENINGFLGMLCDSVRPGLVFDYCSRRSLEDIIRQEDIKLDWSFRLSLLTDLVRGMRYLHGSLLRHHGRLTSRNCVIDARWVLKVTDYGLPGIYEYQNLSQPNRPIRDLLWKAPELLRDEALMTKGTQAADVFSFAIIMQEVVVRGAPYCMIQLTPPEILVRLKKPPPMIRPSVSKGAAPPDAINIMKQCWAELPEMRPDFNQINDLFKKLNQGRRLNIVDTMFQMLEKYSSNLEELIKDRTEQLDLEKKKTEQLLNRMLPSSVADQLKLGMPVAPEEFDEVTIYFSDIVGFTSISAYSTPFEVVDLLNDLYTAFDSTINHYNVYKVETIGDAYMVVGGVPKRIDDHASQIATMALDLLHLSGKFRIRHLHNIPLMLRIGIHTGPCCAGVVGMTMPRYCLFGDTVNTASRMESTGSPWCIHVSEKTWSVLREVGGYHLEYRGLTKLKGKGEMNTYWLLGKDGFKKELPVPPEIGLDEELMRLGRQHYMARRDSTVDSLPSIKGLSCIQTAKLQNDSVEASVSEVMEEDVPNSSGDVKEIMFNLQHQILETDNIPKQEPEGEESACSKAVVSNGRTCLVAPCLVVKETKSFKDDSSSTKPGSKSNCVKSKGENTVSKELCDSVVVPKINSKDKWEGHQLSRHSCATSRSPLPPAPTIQENHVDCVIEIELQGGLVITKTPGDFNGAIRGHSTPSTGHRVVPKSNSGGRNCVSQEDSVEPASRAPNFSLGPRRESCRGPSMPRTVSPPLLCHNKVFPQHGVASPVRDHTRSVSSHVGSWGHDLHQALLQHQQQQEMGESCPTALRGVTAECQVHPHSQDPPSPTESTML
ncbi:LOW QUALITY PROTEIN: uncharacterized protein [Panulirus ornatus]|uniref:LOW QUALITY PROTEIN: uncharacterized protein n=1 Tax=Panulirus ornatus TaxID=150431 RepID=UPI003A8710AF